MNVINIDRKEVKIRPMVSSDIASTLNIWWTSIPEKEMLASQLGGRLDLSLIADYEGHLVGFILARVIYAGLPMTGVGVIFFIAVKTDYQNCGIGSMLIDELKRNCKIKEIETIRALVPQNDASITKYFKRFGFRPSNTINLDSPV
jgi:ribosomal protein S18 acetylase RimI-like enzyme